MSQTIFLGKKPQKLIAQKKKKKEITEQKAVDFFSPLGIYGIRVMQTSKW